MSMIHSALRPSGFMSLNWRGQVFTHRNPSNSTTYPINAKWNTEPRLSPPCSAFSSSFIPACNLLLVSFQPSIFPLPVFSPSPSECLIIFFCLLYAGQGVSAPWRHTGYWPLGSAPRMGAGTCPTWQTDLHRSRAFRFPKIDWSRSVLQLLSHDEQFPITVVGKAVSVWWWVIIFNNHKQPKMSEFDPFSPMTFTSQLAGEEISDMHALNWLCWSKAPVRVLYEPQITTTWANLRKLFFGQMLWLSNFGKDDRTPSLNAVSSQFSLTHACSLLLHVLFPNPANLLAKAI